MNIAVVFPGQGSQSIGMLNDFTADWPVVQETFQQASDALGYDLWSIVSDGPAEKLNQTEITQPAMLAADVAILRVFSQLSQLQPHILAGHSLGEYAALVAANVLSFDDAIKLVSLRGKLMQHAVPEGAGAMAAIIGLADEKILEACATATTDSSNPVEAVNFNSPGQVVIAGTTGAVEKAMELCKKAGAKRAMLLPVSVPSHSSLMKPAADKLADALQEITFNTPDVTILHNVDAAAHESADAIRDALTRQLYNPVRWVQTVETLADSADTIIECGPGKVLTGLCKRIAKGVPSYCTATPADIQKFLDSI